MVLDTDKEAALKRVLTVLYVAEGGMLCGDDQIRTLSDATGLSEEVVQAALDTLVAAGFVTKES